MLVIHIGIFGFVLTEQLFRSIGWVSDGAAVRVVRHVSPEWRKVKKKQDG